MIIFKKFGKTIKIRDNHWKRLRARYNPKDAVFDDENYLYKIKRNCPFCMRYSECAGCPFEVFDTEGCITFLERVFPDGTEFESGEISEVTWDESYDKEARKQLNRL